MNTCATCKYWNQHKDYAFSEETKAYTILVKKYRQGTCTMPRMDFDCPEDGIEAPDNYCAGHGDHRDGQFVTGRKFGCIHYARRKREAGIDPVAQTPIARDLALCRMIPKNGGDYYDRYAETLKQLANDRKSPK